MKDSQPSDLPIRFVVSQFETVRTGPGTFVDYLKRAMMAGRLNLEFICDEKPRQDYKGKVYAYTFHERIRQKIRGSWAFALWLFAWLASCRKYPDYRASWVFDPIFAYFFLRHPEFRRRSVVMVNDDNQMQIKVSLEQGNRSMMEGLLARFACRCEARALEMADIVVANSIYTRDCILRTYHLPEEKVVVLYKAVNLSMFKPKVELRKEPDELRIGFVKSDWRRGGLTQLVRAVNQLEFPAKVHFAGCTEVDLQSVRAQLAKEGLDANCIVPVGRLSRDEMPDFFQQMDAIVLLSNMEALGVSLLEGMAAGVPLLGSDVGGIPEVLDFGKAGFLLDREDISAVIGALREIYTLSEATRNKVTRGLQHVENFSTELMFQNIERISLQAASLS